jgi:Na+:H+ antiporter, NhaC family
VTSPLVPWNSCGAFMAATLGVATFAYLPFAFLNLLNPIAAIVAAAFVGKGMAKPDPVSAEAAG